MNIVVDLQLAFQPVSSPHYTPDVEQCVKIIAQVLKTLELEDNKECTIRIVDEQESAELNQQYRGKEGPTNILSFDFEMPELPDIPELLEVELLDVALLGDLIICAPLVLKEAAEQGKSVNSHYSHLITHGILHLLGYDHIEAAEAIKMEDLECQILAELGFANPYL